MLSLIEIYGECVGFAVVVIDSFEVSANIFAKMPQLGSPLMN